MKKIILLFIILLAVPIISAQEQVDIYVFYGQGCPHCANLLAFLDEITGNYPTLNIVEKETYFNKENAVLFVQMADAFNVKV